MPSASKAAICLALFSTVDAARAMSKAKIPSFDSFVQLYDRSYQKDSAEYHMRRTIYEKNRVEAEQQNSRSNRLWTAGVNKLWDYTDAEYNGLLGWDGSVRPSARSAHAVVRKHDAFLQNSLRDSPKDKVWSNLQMNQQVKDQGACGSCWAIAAATVLEGHYEIYSGKFRTFSAQQMVDCTPNPRNCGGKGGCQGATAELAMEFVMKHGCADETEVPYNAADGTCTVGNHSVAANTTVFTQMSSAVSSVAPSSGAAAFGMTGWETLPLNKYAPLINALQTGPVAVSACASAWGQYESGIFNGCNKDCVVNHAVTAVGYGEADGTKYWLIQNSWGSFWGEQGHIRLERHEGDKWCGMNNDPQAGVACEGETDPVPVCGMCGVLFDSVVPHFKPSIA